MACIAASMRAPVLLVVLEQLLAFGALGYCNLSTCTYLEVANLCGGSGVPVIVVVVLVVVAVVVVACRNTHSSVVT